MKSILLIGLGRFGQYVAHRLVDMGHDVLAVDHDEDRVNSVLPFVFRAVIGDSTDEQFLKDLGVDNFDVCIVAIGDNFQNSLETTNLLKELGARKVIARATRERQEKFLLNNGADEVVYPEKQMAGWLATRCASESILRYMELDEEYSIFEIQAPKSWDGKSVLQLNLRQKFGINILGIREGGKTNMNITPDMMIKACQSVLVLGKPDEVQRCFRL